MFTFRLYHFVLLGVLSMIVLLILLFLIGDALDNAALDASADRAIGLIHLGMNIDEAVAVLRKEGFGVSEKHEMPDTDYNYCTMYKVSVSLRGNIPMSATVRYVLDLPSNKRPWMFIIASLDGKIVEIHR